MQSLRCLLTFFSFFNIPQQLGLLSGLRQVIVNSSSDMHLGSGRGARHGSEVDLGIGKHVCKRVCMWCGEVKSPWEAGAGYQASTMGGRVGLTAKGTK